MRKLTLDLDMLAVETFAPADATDSRGTVAGHSGGCDIGDTDLDLLTCAGSCPPDCEHQAVFALTNDGSPTCTYSCPGKCFNTNLLATQCC